ncbi:MAG TPA: S24/S26 family peptidase [Candidatus Polarisedimenticolaceae bacterium]
MRRDPPAPTADRMLDAAISLLGERAGRAVFEVRGRSMRPTLSDGDAVLVVLADRRIRPGDLAVFRLGGDAVVHRCVRVRREGLVFRGDGREALDPLVAVPEVLGRVVALRRSGAWLGLEGTLARGYGRAIAIHARFWSAARRGLGPPASRLDRGTLRMADRLLFGRCHRTVPAPPGFTGPDGVG